MKIIKIGIILILILFLSVVNMACTQNSEKPSPESDDGPKPVPPIIDEIENDIITIMSELDLIPYYEKQITEKEKKKQERIQLEILIGKKGEQGGEEGNKQAEGGGGDSNQGGDGNEIDKIIQFKPAPITINDVLLTEVLKQEIQKEDDKKEKEIPDDIIVIWHDINTKIMGLHDKWNSLEPEIIKSDSSPEAIEGFKKTLNSLTISGNEYNHMATLINANILTYYIPDLISDFKKKFPSGIYNLKFHIRQIVLDSSNDNYDKAMEHLERIKAYKESLDAQLKEKKLTEPAEKLTSSIKAFEESLELKDINIIKIKASVVMKNINSIKEELSK